MKITNADIGKFMVLEAIAHSNNHTFRAVGMEGPRLDIAKHVNWLEIEQADNADEVAAIVSVAIDAARAEFLANG